MIANTMVVRWQSTSNHIVPCGAIRWPDYVWQGYHQLAVTTLAMVRQTRCAMGFLRVHVSTGNFDCFTLSGRDYTPENRDELDLRARA